MDKLEQLAQVVYAQQLKIEALEAKLEQITKNLNKTSKLSKYNWLKGVQKW